MLTNLWIFTNFPGCSGVVLIVHDTRHQWPQCDIYHFFAVCLDNYPLLILFFHQDWTTTCLVRDNLDNFCHNYLGIVRTIWRVSSSCSLPLSGSQPRPIQFVYFGWSRENFAKFCPAACQLVYQLVCDAGIIWKDNYFDLTLFWCFLLILQHLFLVKIWSTIIFLKGSRTWLKFAKM